MIVTIHQPNLFPWLGFFDKMQQADVFISLDNVPFTKGGFQNRVQVKGANGPQWLTIPVATKGKSGQLTSEVECNSELPWRKNHLKTFEALYRATPGYDKLFSCTERLYLNDSSTHLTEFTEAGIQMIRDMLDIRNEYVKASELNAQGSSSQLLCNLVKAVGGSIYLSGPSGRSYLDERLFSDNGIRVVYHSFDIFEYPQRYGAFAGGLSALDYLFNQLEHSELQKGRRITA